MRKSILLAFALLANAIACDAQVINFGCTSTFNSVDCAGFIDSSEMLPDTIEFNIFRYVTPDSVVPVGSGRTGWLPIPGPERNSQIDFYPVDPNTRYMVALLDRDSLYYCDSQTPSGICSAADAKPMRASYDGAALLLSNVPETQNGEAAVIDLAGRTVGKFRLSGQPDEIVPLHLPAGVFFVAVGGGPAIKITVR